MSIAQRCQKVGRIGLGGLTHKKPPLVLVVFFCVKIFYQSNQDYKAFFMCLNFRVQLKVGAPSLPQF